LPLSSMDSRIYHNNSQMNICTR